ncbi:MAG: ATP-dependent DNA helicase RecG [Actinobacteria bacterium]|jgi:ATP-dependent DNA helicase RecG|nr:ATP-dependent DNA helicase RecG [Actinomycetota bacterium]MCL6094544.1 ATP-dependent DNA helicase RecG [Actinomycetota bacterium]
MADQKIGEIRLGQVSREHEYRSPEYKLPTASPLLSLIDLQQIKVDRVKGVGPKQRNLLAMAGIDTVYDLVTYYPRSYLDRTRQAHLVDIRVGEEAAVVGEVVNVSIGNTRTGRSMITMTLEDDGHLLHVVFFNQPWRSAQLEPGVTVRCFGRLSRFRQRLQMVNPAVDILGREGAHAKTGRLVAIYPSSEKAHLASWQIQLFVGNALSFVDHLRDPLPPSLRRRLALLPRAIALHEIHFPSSYVLLTKARQRLAFDELFRLQLHLAKVRRLENRLAKGVSQPTRESGLVSQFIAGLPFKLTDSQSKAIKEISADLASDRPMRRLLQGEVGSGKTIVAVATLLAAVENGHQAALVAPTTVLAEQHYLVVDSLFRRLMNSTEDHERLRDGRWSRGASSRSSDVVLRYENLDTGEGSEDHQEDERYWERHREAGELGGLTTANERAEETELQQSSKPVRIALLTSRIPATERSALIGGLAEGEYDIAIGTHALFSDEVRFRQLGVVVVDEQHRFGVEQRDELRIKAAAYSGSTPDLLVMTATPIPRTAAMTVFGDLDLTVMTELPSGRRPVTTIWCQRSGQEAEAWKRIRDQVRAGKRAYVICPLVDGSEKIESKAVTSEYQRLKEGELAGIEVGLMHAQMKPSSRQAVMNDFRDGKIQVLVSTTVVEVGVDVPDATVIVIEDAARFGIAQLHQLRGRVGRGKDPSWCYLLGEARSAEGRARLEALCSSVNGFELAEIDLHIRGEGTILGTRQQGRSDLKVASLEKDVELCALARKVASEIIAMDEDLNTYVELARELNWFADNSSYGFLLKS